MWQLRNKAEMIRTRGQCGERTNRIQLSERKGKNKMKTDGIFFKDLTNTKKQKSQNRNTQEKH